MNVTRVALAAVAAWIADSIYGFVVYANLLGGQFGAYPAIFRTPAEEKLPFLFAGTFLAMLALAYMYAKGYEGRSGVAEGLRFGVLVAFFVLGYVSIGNYALMNIGRRLSGLFAIGAFVEMIIVGVVIGAVYKPVARGSTAR